MSGSGSRTALVLGASGGIGGEIARALRRHGWTIRALLRDPSKLDPALGEARRGDAMQRDDVVAAAQGAALIVHAVNPAGYRGWAEQVVPMLANTLAAGERSGARIVFPGTIYNYGPDAGAVLKETSPQNPETKKGRLRVAMEQALEKSAQEGRTRALILRAGDYFGPRPGNNWFSQGLIKPGRPVTSIVYPGPFDIGHSWAYLPDVGETFAALLDQEARLEPFARFHFGGCWFEPGVEMAYAVRRALGRNTIPIRKLPWALLRLMTPFNETLREMMELRYLWQRPLRLDNAKLTGFLGREPATPLDEAVAATLKGMRCS